MRTVEVIAGLLVALGVVNIIFYSKQTPAVLQTGFGGASQLFGTLIAPGGSAGLGGVGGVIGPVGAVG